jgi:uncharacterized protein (TIGR02284 family)
MSKLLERLNDLIALDIDATEAYSAAIQRIDDSDVRRQLGEFRADHQRHVRDLSAVVARYGGQARAKPDMKGFILKGFTAISSSMGDGVALRAMQGNEQLTTRTYEKALEETWPDDVRELIVQNYGDEQRHLAAIEQIIRLRRSERGEARPTK